MRVRALVAEIVATACLCLLLGCVETVSPVSSFCPQPIHPDPVTRSWLDTLNPPPEANHYFKLIGDQQKSIEKACGS